MAEFQKIKTFLWYDKEAEEAANYYIAAFKNSKIDHIEHLGDIGPRNWDPCRSSSSPSRASNSSP